MSTANRVEIPPMDEHNTQLVNNVHPNDWTNPTPNGRYNLVVIGAGTAGLVTAIGAAGLGAKVALVERHLMGGDCLNVGCVPSKVLIRSARAFADVRDAARLRHQRARWRDGRLPKSHGTHAKNPQRHQQTRLRQAVRRGWRRRLHRRSIAFAGERQSKRQQ
jgi:2-polyprenyl-6-methoxyphenol hydroxylase-like FAD-dependent oxidoreductase